MPNLYFVELIASYSVKVVSIFSLQLPSTPSAPSEAKFEIGDLVLLTPDTKPGVDPFLSIACYDKATYL